MSTNIGRFEGETENIEHTCLTLAKNLPDSIQTMWFKSCMIKLAQKLHAVATSKEALLHALNITTSLLHICNVQQWPHALKGQVLHVITLAFSAAQISVWLECLTETSRATSSPWLQTPHADNTMALGEVSNAEIMSRDLPETLGHTTGCSWLYHGNTAGTDMGTGRKPHSARQQPASSTSFCLATQ